MPDNDVDALVSAIEGFRGTTGKDFADHLMRELGWTRPDAETMIRAVLSFEKLRQQNRWALGELGDEVTRAPNSPAENDNDRKKLAARIVRLIEPASAALVVGALDAMGADERTLESAQVVTQIRPVFRPGDDSSAIGVLVHSLVISYDEDGTTRNFSVAVDDTDLSRLAETVEQARSRADQVRSRFSSEDFLISPMGTEKDA